MSNLLSFHVRNLGPIAEGTVELHPLTILIGKNNTGKTYMAQAIYAAYKTLTLQRARGRVKPFITVDESKELLNRLHAVETDSTDVLHGSLKQKAERWMLSRLNQVGEDLSNRLMVYFDLEDLSTLKRWESDGQLSVRVTAKGSEANSTLQFGLDSDTAASVRLPRVTASDFEDSYAYEFLHDLMPGLDMSRLNEEHSSQLEMIKRRLSTALDDFLWSGLLLPSVGLNGMAHYLPAGRSGLLEAWTDVVRLRLEQDRERLALAGREPAALGGIALDFLSRLQELIRSPMSRYRQNLMRHYGRTRPRYLKHELRSKVEAVSLHLEELIDGDVSLDRGRERVPSFAYTQRGKSIPIQQASSMVAELAPLLSWIKHILHPGDLLLIDEPEAHMHPEAVLAVAQTLVALTQSGVKVLCTTHSSEFLHQISNCMLRVVQPDEDVSADATGIHAADVGVYRFERTDQFNGSQSNDTVIIPVDIDPNWGIPEDEHVAVAEHLADETAELIERIEW